MGLSRRRVGQIVTEIDGNEREANQTTKLPTHQGKREKQTDNIKVAPKKLGTDPDYIKDRLTRDAEQDPRAGEHAQSGPALELDTCTTLKRPRDALQAPLQPADRHGPLASSSRNPGLISRARLNKASFVYTVGEGKTRETLA